MFRLSAPSALQMGFSLFYPKAVFAKNTPSKAAFITGRVLIKKPVLPQQHRLFEQAYKLFISFPAKGNWDS